MLRTSSASSLPVRLAAAFLDLNLRPMQVKTPHTRVAPSIQVV